MPPWAQALALSASVSLVRTTARCPSDASLHAVQSPAMPEPMMTGREAVMATKYTGETLRRSVYVRTRARSAIAATRTRCWEPGGHDRIHHAAGAHRLHDLGEEQEDHGGAQADGHADRGARARVVTASGAPKSAMMKQVTGIATFRDRSTISLLASLPERRSASTYRPSSA